VASKDRSTIKIANNVRRAKSWKGVQISPLLFCHWFCLIDALYRKIIHIHARKICTMSPTPNVEGRLSVNFDTTRTCNVFLSNQTADCSCFGGLFNPWGVRAWWITLRNTSMMHLRTKHELSRLLVSSSPGAPKISACGCFCLVGSREINLENLSAWLPIFKSFQVNKIFREKKIITWKSWRRSFGEKSYN
jgi:hypothetical protein